MEIYENLFKKGYLLRNDINSPISLAGMKKICNKITNDYNFIDIKFIYEKEFINEFEKFFKLSKEFIHEDNSINLSQNNLNTDEEDLLFDVIKFTNEKYESLQDKNLFNDAKSYYFIIKKIGLFKIENSIINNLICKKILREVKKAELNFFIWEGKNGHYSLVFNINSYYFFFDPCSNFYQRWPTETIIVDKHKIENSF